MKTRLLIAALTTLLTFNLNFAQENPNSSWEASDFKPGEQVFLFGNNVKLRSDPRIESEVIELLRIGEWVEIIEKTKFSWPYKGFDSPFYKVKYDTEVGYILGGLLSLEKKSLNGIDYYFAISKEGERSFLNMRHVEEGDYVEQKTALSNVNFKIKVLDNKGVPHLDSILLIDYQAEACGEEGGGIYFFVHGNHLIKVGELSQISEAGIFYYAETFVFPDDENGVPEKILFKKEQAQNLDEASQWTQTSTESRLLSWVNGNLIPDLREKVPNSL
ncbi:SH3 domain-containing protein [Flagellimonas allohymeniacidonis]|uniref:SH3 domain-containing protein n=1 Tax=Flagellimonas allohymeniacidonis TaxID=2517819 RepID=A0A4Q8QG11_9FLAO|nr:SH3 domain-containing protein [Allomuricauda hymeniacidonis]TAI48138.1 SH3 domain-containing protein [Allomuricauda hymeniacidonis]